MLGGPADDTRPGLERAVQEYLERCERVGLAGRRARSQLLPTLTQILAA